MQPAGLRTGRPIRSGGLEQLLAQFFVLSFRTCLLRIHASFDSCLCFDLFTFRCDLNSIHSTQTSLVSSAQFVEFPEGGWPWVVVCLFTTAFVSHVLLARVGVCLNPPAATQSVEVQPVLLFAILFSFWSLRTAWSSLWLTSRRLCTFRGPGLNAPRTGRPIRSGGLEQLLAQFLVLSFRTCLLRIRASFDSCLCFELFAFRRDLNSIHFTTLLSC